MFENISTCKICQCNCAYKKNRPPECLVFKISDLLDPQKQNNFAFITNTAGKIGMVTDEFYFIKNLNFPDEQLVPVKFSGKTYTPAQRDSITKKLSEFTTAYFETARYLIMNNHD